MDCGAVQEAATEKGILEQSQISLLSLTHTTLQDQDTTEGEEPDGRAEEGQEGREVEVSVRGDVTLLILLLCV